MADENQIFKSYNLRPSCSKKKLKECVPSLPKEVIFEMLLRLPAEILYKVMKNVCHEWRTIIQSSTFIDAHLQRSPCGLLIWTTISSVGNHVQLEKNGVYISDTQLMNHCSPLSTCNGLVLFGESEASRVHVINPVTWERITIPTMERWNSRFRLGYASCSGEYKVVYRYVSNSKYQFRIFTLGVDTAWRCLSTEHQLRIALNSVPYSNTPLSVEGYIYWYDYYREYNHPCVLSLDLETETFRLSPVPSPEGCNEKRVWVIYPFGTSISFIVRMGKFLWEVWVLSGLGKGELNKLFTIDLECQKHVLDGLLRMPRYRLYPLGFLKNGELVVFSLFSNSSRYIFVYDTNTGAIKSYQLNIPEGTGYRMAVPHVKSLVTMQRKKSTIFLPAKERILLCRIDALEKQLSSTKKALKEALVREEKLLGSIEEKKRQ